MGFGFLSWVLLLSMLCKPLSCQLQPNTDGYFVSDFLQKMGLGLASVQDYNISASVCSWPGVSCDAKQESVVKLVASGLGLSGPIPDTTIGKLSKLQHLDLSNNAITALCSDFWSLGSLKSLNLSKNRISGSLASNIGNFGSLQNIDLSLNNFSGEIPSGILNCRSLVSMDMSSNMFDGSLPDGFSATFRKLRTLNLADNSIHGRDADFLLLESLIDLNVSGNLFQGSVNGFFRNRTLEVVDLSRNQFQGHISEVPSGLVYLDLSENDLSGEILHNLSKAQNLKHLNLAANRFKMQSFPKIEMLSGLEYLNLSSTGLIGHIPIGIRQLKNLKFLDLSKNQLDGRIPVWKTLNLQNLDLSRNNLSGEVPASILDKLPRMKSFNFSYNNLTLCAHGVSAQILKTAFLGSTNSCPIAANPELFTKRASSRHTGLKIAITLTVSVLCLMAFVMFLIFGCRRKDKLWTVKQAGSYKEEPQISGPFSFQTDSTTWVADVKQATMVPVVIFEKPLLTITFADLLSATSNFDRGTLLAEGKFGPVYRGVLPGGFHVAVKVLVHGSTLTDQEAGRELEYLGRIKHPNLVPLTGYCLAGDQRIAIYDYMENGNLQNLLHDLPLGIQTTEDWSKDTWEVEVDDDHSGIQHVGSEMLLTTWRFRHKIALGTARALAFLHHGCFPSIIHRDVKASSVYLDYNLEPRLSDFGLAKVFGNGIDEDIICGSPGYLPPEFSLPENNYPTAKSDVYCFGVVLFELITGKKPVGDSYEEGNLVGWVRGLVRKNQGLRAIDPKIRGTGPDDQMEEALKIGFLCTADHPSKRPSMQQVIGLLKDIEPCVV